MNWIIILFLFLAIHVKGGIINDNPDIDSTSQAELIGGRYILMQSGFPVVPKTLQYQNINLLLNDIQYGFNKDISIAAGVVAPFYIYLSPLFSKEVAPNQRIILGDIAITSMFLDNVQMLNFNLMYAGYTYGTKNNHVTAALGYAHANILPNPSLVFQFGGCKQLSNQIYLVGESWFSPGYQEMKGVSKWQLNSAGQPILADPSNPLTSPIKLNFPSLLITRNTFYVNIQIRMISKKHSNKSWSFGLMYLANWGGKYQEQGAYGEVRNLTNNFVLPMPSISFIHRIGDFRPEFIPNVTGSKWLNK